MIVLIHTSLLFGQKMALKVSIFCQKVNYRCTYLLSFIKIRTCLVGQKFNHTQTPTDFNGNDHLKTPLKKVSRNPISITPLGRLWDKTLAKVFLPISYSPSLCQMINDSSCCLQGLVVAIGAANFALSEVQADFFAQKWL